MHQAEDNLIDESTTLSKKYFQLDMFVLINYTFVTSFSVLA